MTIVPLSSNSFTGFMICGIALSRIYIPIFTLNTRLLCSVRVAKRSFFCDPTFCLNKLTTHVPPHMVIGHFQLSLKCRLPNCIRFDVFYRCICKVETRVCKTLRSCAKRSGGLAFTISLGASRSFNPALLVINNLF